VRDIHDLSGRYAVFTRRLIDSVLAAPGDTSSEQRRAALARAAGAVLSGGEDALGRYVDTVARHAYTLTDDDLTALQRAGNSEDVIFEITVSAALGAALGRLERGLAALRGEEPASSFTTDPIARYGPHPLTPSPSGRGGTKEPR